MIRRGNENALRADQSTTNSLWLRSAVGPHDNPRKLLGQKSGNDSLFSHWR